MNEYPEDGRTVGSIVILQSLVALILHSHPERNVILNRIVELSENLRNDANNEIASGNVEKYLFLSSLSTGAEDALDVVRGIVVEEP